MTDSSQMSCSDVLMSDRATIGYQTTFDQGNGSVLLIGGKACWEEIMQSLQEADSFVTDQLSKLEQNGVDTEEMGLPDLETYRAMIDMVADYTDGYLLATSWSWNDKSVKNGESIGLCVQQDSGSNATCWSYTKSIYNGMYEPVNASYLVDTETYGEGSELTDYSDISEEVFPALYGGWLCSQVIELYDMAHVDCIRFIPSEKSSSERDPRISPGEVSVITYMSGRDGSDLAPIEGAPANVMMATRQFKNYTIDLMGAMSGVTAASAALVAGLVATLF